MKTIKITYNENGLVTSSSYAEDEIYIAKGEDKALEINATFPANITGSVRAYLQFPGGGTVVDCGEVRINSHAVSLYVSADYLAYNFLKVGFEVLTSVSEIRFEPIRIEVDEFVNISGKSSSQQGYTVSVKVGEVKTLAPDEQARIENVGTEKDMILNFGIPQGIKGDSGYSPIKGTDYWTADDKAEIIDEVSADINAHIDDTDNPHGVTKEQLGLENVDNTSDADKPISNAVQTALNGKVDKVTGKGLSSNDFTDDDKSKLDGLSNYDDTEIIRLISEEATARSTADEGKVDKVSGKGLSTNDLTDVLLERLNNQTFDGTIESQLDEYGEWMPPDIDNLDTGVYRVIDREFYAYHYILFVSREDGSGYRVLFGNTYIKYALENSDGWDDWQYLSFIDVKEHLNSKQNPHSVTKAQVGLENVDNTSDLNKPISTAVQTALDAKADKTEVAENDNALKLDITALKEKSLPHTTASGYPISLTDHLNEEQVIDYKIYGNSTQDGTPSTDSPVEIQSVGDLVTDTASEHYGKYDVPVNVTGKNIIRRYTTIIYPLTVNAYGNTVVINGNSTSNVGINYLDTYKTLLRKGTYTFTYFYDSGTTISNPEGMTIGLRKSDNSWLTSVGIYPSNYQKASVRKSFTVSSDTYVSLGLVGNGNYDNWKFNFQLEYGADSTDFEPYKGETKHIYLDEPLRKIGDYADCIDYKNQNVVRQIEVLDDTGTKTIDESLGVLATPTTEVITVPDLITPNSGITNIFASTSTQPSSIDVTYYQDINKIITELKNAILAQGGNV